MTSSSPNAVPIPSSSSTSSSPSFSSSSFPDDKNGHNDDDLSLLPWPWSLVAVVCVTGAVVTAVGGNVLVVLSYWRDRQLRDVHNLYLLHLALCDLLIGAVSMPLYLLYTVLDRTWLLGAVACKLFLVEDFTVCCMSTLIVILVAWDRLNLLRLGASYQVVETHKRAYVKLTICWICSLLLYSPAILLWDVVRGNTIVPRNDCDVEFHDNIPFVVVTEVLSFSVPFISLTVLNSRLFLALKKRSKARCRGAGSTPAGRSGAECCGFSALRFGRKTRKINHISDSPCPVVRKMEREEIPCSFKKICSSVSARVGVVLTTELLEPCSKTPSHNFDHDRSSVSESRYQSQTATIFHNRTSTNQSEQPVYSPPSSSSQLPEMPSVSQSTVTTTPTSKSSLSSNATPSSESPTLSFTESKSTSQTQIASLFRVTSPPSQTTSSSPRGTPPGRRTHHQNVHRKSDKRETRVAVILTGLVLALVVFWLPYSVTTIIVATCEGCVNEDLYEVFNWLLWIKSCVNPFLYAYNSPRFRHNFRELLARVLPLKCTRAKRKAKIAQTG